MSVYSAPDDAAEIASYAEAGVDRTLFLLPTEPRDTTLRLLDGYTALMRDFG